MESETLNCPECGKPLKPKKSWGGLLACYCTWGGRKPTHAQIEKAVDAWQEPADPLPDLIGDLLTSPDLCPEARALIEAAQTAQRTGTMPELHFLP